MSGLVALIPARSGSKRVPGKNVRPLRGHPLLAYTVAAALDSGVFDDVIVSTESDDIAAVARHYGAEVPFLRPAALAADLSPDIDWLQHAVATLRDAGRSFEAFSILRPTSPLRQATTIAQAWDQLRADDAADSLRAVELCAQHPAKMWIVEGERMRPLLDDGGASPPWHSTAYQALPVVHVQNASLEMAWTRVLDETGTIAGSVIRPFSMPRNEGFDINRPEDWFVLERLLDDGVTALPAITAAPFGGTTS